MKQKVAAIKFRAKVRKNGKYKTSEEKMNILKKQAKTLDFVIFCLQNQVFLDKINPQCDVLSPRRIRHLYDALFYKRRLTPSLQTLRVI